MDLYYRRLNINEYNKIIELWNRNIGILFPMDEKLFLGNLEMDKSLDQEYIIGAFDEGKLAAFIIYKKHIADLGVIPAKKENGNINSIIVDFQYRNIGIGSKLLEICTKELKNQGVKSLEIGRDTFHFFPGLPTEYIKSVEFFKNRGFKEEYKSYDLVCDIRDINLDEIRMLRGLKINNDDRFSFEELTEKYKNSLMEFLKKTFPGRWLADMKIFLGYHMKYKDIIITIDKKENSVVGFSHIFDKNSKVLGPGVYWRGLLGDNYGGLGPIGIDTEYRKLGLGLTLLYRCIEIQKKRGVGKMCIDWTDLFNFYGLFNFMPWKSYIHMNKKI